MSLLQRAFAFVGSFGIIGPHHGHEADLLLKGTKPIGFLCVFNCPEAEKDASEIQNARDIARLDEGVHADRLSKQVFTFPPCPPRDKYGGTAHFYCQKGLEAEMHEIATAHQALWEGSSQRPMISKECGLYFGYTESDVALFNGGGYEALPPVKSFIMQYTHELRKTCRILAMNQSSPEGPV